MPREPLAARWVVLLAAVAAPRAAALGEWSSVTPLPSAVDGHACSADPGGRVLCTGDFVGASAVESTDGGDSWAVVNTSAPWAPRSLHNMATLPDEDGTILVAFGFNSSSSSLYGDAWSSSDGGGTWKQVASPGARDWAAMTVVPDGANGTVLVVGGRAADSSAITTAQRSTDRGATWTSVASPFSSAEAARYGSALVTMPNNSVLLVGGENSGAGIIYGEAFLSDDGGDSWRLVSTSSLIERFAIEAAALPDGRVFVVGGRGVSSLFPSLLVSGDYGVTWTEEFPSGGLSREDFALVLVGPRLLAIGGIDTVQVDAVDAYSLCLANETLTEAGCGAAPTACPPGSFGTLPSCMPCPIGTFGDLSLPAGSSAVDACPGRCPTGSYGVATGATDALSACAVCPAGSYSASSGAANCAACPPGAPCTLGGGGASSEVQCIEEAGATLAECPSGAAACSVDPISECAARRGVFAWTCTSRALAAGILACPDGTRDNGGGACVPPCALVTGPGPR